MACQVLRQQISIPQMFVKRSNENKAIMKYVLIYSICVEKCIWYLGCSVIYF